MVKQYKQKRPYFKYSIIELIEIFNKHKEDKVELTLLLKELSHRSTIRAKELEKKIILQLDTIENIDNKKLHIDHKNINSVECNNTIDEKKIIERDIKNIENEISYLNSRKHDIKHTIYFMLCILLLGGLVSSIDNLLSGIHDTYTKIIFFAGLGGIALGFWLHKEEKQEKEYRKNLQDILSEKKEKYNKLH